MFIIENFFLLCKYLLDNTIGKTCWHKIKTVGFDIEYGENKDEDV